MTSTLIEQNADVLKGTWTIDAAHSEVSFSVKHAGISTVRGSFTEFGGALTLDPEAPHASEAHVDIHAKSIDTRDANRDNHLRTNDFFSIEQFPTWTFHSKRVDAVDGEAFRMHGDLTIKGVTHEVPLDVTFNGVATDAFGNTRAGFEAETSISRKDFGVDWNAPLDKGKGVLVGDKVKIQLDISAIKQQDAAAQA